MNPSPVLRITDARSWIGVAIAAALVAVAMSVAPQRASASDDEWPTSITTSGPAAPGGTVTISLTITPTRTVAALTDVEVFSTSGEKAFQFFWDAQPFTAGRSRTYTTSWKIPGDIAPGTYRVTAGVFRVGWGELYAWNDTGTTLTITAAGATTTTAPTTTVRPTTTAAPTTTVRPTTTIAPTTTLPPTTSAPAGTAFVEDFASAAGFYDRFDFGFSAIEDVVGTANDIGTYEGDHSLACSGPDQRRQIRLGAGEGPVTPQQVASQTGKSQIFWWCAPGSDATKGHVMTGTNGLGYMIAYFSPKQAFTNVSRVCWDQNATTMDSKWTNVVIAPVGDVERVRQQKGFLDLGFDPPGFQDPSGPTTHTVTPNGVGVKVQNGNISYWQGAGFVGGEEFFGGFQSTDKATRFQHCMFDDGNGTIRVTQQRPDGTVRTRTFAGRFPRGQVRVVFEDDMYDPPKRAGYHADTLTWHWDNIQIG